MSVKEVLVVSGLELVRQRIEGDHLKFNCFVSLNFFRSLNLLYTIKITQILLYLGTMFFFLKLKMKFLKFNILFSKYHDVKNGFSKISQKYANTFAKESI